MRRAATANSDSRPKLLAPAGSAPREAAPRSYDRGSAPRSAPAPQAAPPRLRAGARPVASAPPPRIRRTPGPPMTSSPEVSSSSHRAFGRGSFSARSAPPGGAPGPLRIRARCGASLVPRQTPCSSSTARRWGSTSCCVPGLAARRFRACSARGSSAASSRARARAPGRRGRRPAGPLARAATANPAKRTKPEVKALYVTDRQARRGRALLRDPR